MIKSGSTYYLSNSVYSVTLANSGTYYLRLNNGNNTNTAYSFNLVAPTFPTTALSLNTPTAGTISQLGEQQTYTFTGSVGQLLYFDSLANSTTNPIRTTLYSPSGATNTLGYYVYSDSSPFILTEAGTYKLVIDSNGYTGAYNFQLLDETTSAIALNLNTVTTGTLAASANQFYSFTGTAGEKLDFSGITGSGITAYLYDSNNQNIGSAYYFNGSSSSVTLGNNGTYYLRLNNGNNTNTSYSFNLIAPSFPSTTLSFNTPTTGTISQLGEQDTYTFTGTAGQVLYFDSLANSTTNPIRTTLYSPSGATNNLGYYAYSDSSPFILTETGTYKLVFDSNGYTGAYNFQLLDEATSATAVNLNTVTTGTLAASANQFYSFTGTAGEKLDFNGLTGSGVYAYLSDSNNQSVGTTYYLNGGNSSVTLGNNGTYFLRLNNTNNTSTAYSFNLIAPSFPSTTLSFNTPTAGTISQLGEQDTYTFTGTAGQLLYFDSLANSSTTNYIRTTLYSPSGATNNLGYYAYSDSSPFILTETGTYKLVIDSNGYTGAYNFQLLDLATSPVITLGNKTNGVLTGGLATNTYQLSGKAGQRLQFNYVSASNSSANWNLVGPDGQSLFLANITSNETVTLPTNGTYALELSGNSNTNLSYSFQVNDISDTSVSPSGFFGVSQSGTLAANSIANPITFAGNAGQLIVINSQNQSSPISIKIADPNNNVIYNGSATVNSFNYNGGAYVLPRSGNYTLTLTNNTSSVGAYNLVVLDINANSTAYTVGTTESGTLNPSLGIQIFRFTGTVGQKLYYDALQNSSSNISAFIINPSGNQVINFGNTNSDSNSPFTLNEAGTYYLVQDGTSSSGTATYNFQLLDEAASATVLSLNTATTGTLAALTNQFYSFTGTAGEKLYFDGLTGSGITASLYNSNNQNLGSTSLNGGQFPVTLGANGTYFLDLNNGNNASTAYSFNLIAPTFPQQH